MAISSPDGGSTPQQRLWALGEFCRGDYYATHTLTLAQHPSETDARVLVFGLFAAERLEFGRGISSEGEPDLWLRSYTGEIEHWIELGQPEEADVRRSCGRARRVSVVGPALT